MSSNETLAARVSKAAAEIDAPKLDKVNPHFKSKYASLTSWNKVIRPALLKYGFAVRVDIMEGQTATLIAYDGAEEMRLSSLPFFAGSNMQQLGSAVTYATRYLYAMWTGLAADDDDDGNAAVSVEKAPRTAAKPKARITTEDGQKLASFASMVAQCGFDLNDAKGMIWEAYQRGGIGEAEKTAQNLVNDNS